MYMKQVILNITVFFLIVLAFIGCEKDYQVYNANLEAVSFNLKKLTNGEDSLVYSFAFTPDVVEEILEIPLQLYGFTMKRERVVNIIVDKDKTTALEKEEYELLSARMPAESVNGVLKLKVNKSERITNKDVCVSLEIGTSEDLVPGPVSLRKLRVYISNQLTKPANWPNQFGDYSKAKHQFCIEVLGIGSNYNESWSHITHYLNLLNKALYEYNSTHPDAPLRDEYGVEISFPG